jgi:hypothetical protein
MPSPKSERSAGGWLPREDAALDRLIDIGLDEIEQQLGALTDMKRFGLRDVEQPLWNSMGEVAVKLLQPALDQVGGTSDVAWRAKLAPHEAEAAKKMRAHVAGVLQTAILSKTPPAKRRQSMSKQRRWYRLRKTGEIQYFEHFFPPQNDPDWEPIAAPQPSQSSADFALPATMPAVPTPITPTVATAALIERAIGLAEGRINSTSVPPPKPQGIRMTAEQILGARETVGRAADADTPSLEELAARAQSAEELDPRVATVERVAAAMLKLKRLSE